MQQVIQKEGIDSPAEGDGPGLDLPPLSYYEQDLRAADDAVGDAAGGEDLADPPALDEGFDAEFDAAHEAMLREQGQRLRQSRQALFERLNEQQRQAVYSDASSCLVLAAAGSGKTSVLTARIARLVTEGVGRGAVPAGAVLAVTFTNKAAQEMRHRLQGMLDPQVVRRLWVGTFHSLCARLLRDHAKEAGLPRTFAILDVDAQEAMCRGILKDMGLTRSAARQARLAEQASLQGDLLASPNTEQAASERLQSLMEAGAILATDGQDEAAADLVTPAQCARYIGSRKEAQQAPRPARHAVSRGSPHIEQLESVYAEYQARCSRSGLLDFADLLDRAVRLLADNGSIRQSLQQRFSAILVDEFQDTNDLQYRWLQLLKGPQAHVMAVGDDDQSIYAFRGARPQNMQRFLREFTTDAQHPQGRLIKLEHNYRSLPHILQAANAVISRNTNRLGKTLRTNQRDSGDKVVAQACANGPHEAAIVAGAIHDMVRQQGVPPSEIAVLYRANHQSRLIEAELNKRGLPLTVYGGFRFYERQEIKYALAYLDLVCDPSHDLSFAKVANFPPRGLGDTTIEELRQDAQIRRISMMEMVTVKQRWRQELPGQIGNAAAQKRQVTLERFADTVMTLAELAEQMSLPELLERTLHDSGLAAHYQQQVREEGSDDNSRQDNLAELVSAASQFIIDNPQHEELDTLGQLGEYLAHVALMTSTSEADMGAKNTVSLMTVHSAKGLEFDHVFITGLEEDVFPHARAKQEDDEHGSAPASTHGSLSGHPTEDLQDPATDHPGDGPSMQEERRLMYVALTRARKTLRLSHCDQRLINGKVTYLEPSRFLQELPPACLRQWHAPAAAQSTESAGSAAARGPAQSLPLPHRQHPTPQAQVRPPAHGRGHGQSALAALAASTRQGGYGTPASRHLAAGGPTPIWSRHRSPHRTPHAVPDAVPDDTDDTDMEADMEVRHTVHARPSSRH